MTPINVKRVNKEFRQEKSRPNQSGLFKLRRGQILLDLAFFVLDVLAYNWVVLTADHFLGHGTSVLLSNVEVASARCRVQADFDRGWLRHGYSPDRAGAFRPKIYLEAAF